MNIKKKELQGLIKYAEQIKVCINENKKEDALQLIDMLQENVSSYIKENTIGMFTRVRVVDVVEDYDRYEDFIWAEGFITRIREHDDYPYEVEFIDEEMQERCKREGGLLWKLEELEVV